LGRIRRQRAGITITFESNDTVHATFPGGKKISLTPHRAANGRVHRKTENIVFVGREGTRRNATADAIPKKMYENVMGSDPSFTPPLGKAISSVSSMNPVVVPAVNFKECFID